MALWTVQNRKDFLSALDNAQAGDCIQVEALTDAARSARDLLTTMSRLDERKLDFVCLPAGIDTRGQNGSLIFGFCRALLRLERKERREKQQEGIERAREEGKYKGRKPIAVDEALFDSVVSLWKAGQITAREAMARLDLKPNTFYRRIKEQEEMKMKDFKKIEKEFRTEMREAAKQSRQDLSDLKKQVRAEAAEVKHAANEAMDLHDVEKEIRRGRRKAEAAHEDTIRQMKKDVEAEAKELKKLMEET
ncbi:MAG: recombinase family protein [Oscillospiraceae bacterium]|nr:recombinase family protein [Oscillospiraceae bacterium]